MKLLNTILLCTISLWATSQNCDTYVPFNKGTTWELSSYNPKGKLESKATQKIEEVSDHNGGLKASVSQVIVDKKDKPVTNSKYDMTCKGGQFEVSIQSITSAEMMQSFQGMEVDVDADDIVFPDNMAPGQKLNDGKMTIKVGGGTPGMGMLNMTVFVTNRACEKKESVTTPAGTFDCYVVSYDCEMKTIVSIKAKAREWYAKGVGMVKSETYNKNGKLTGYTVLEKFIKG